MSDEANDTGAQGVSDTALDQVSGGLFGLPAQPNPALDLIKLQSDLQKWKIAIDQQTQTIQTISQGAANTVRNLG